METDIGSRSRAGPKEMRGVLPLGTKLRSYEILAVLGQGAFGITYRARDSQLDREVAIKEYLPVALALRENETFVVPRSTELGEQFVWGRERFLDEARTLARLGNAPSIVRVHDFLEANGTAYMVMALAHGETLERRLLRERTLQQDGVERLLYPLLEGLEHVHAVGFLHRDIKPGNIIVDDGGRPTLIDFGASRAAVGGRTASMTAIFTPGYAAVEQFTSGRQGPWTDIYGLAATLYHAVTGGPPPSSFDRVVNDGYEPLLRLKPAGFSAGLLRGIDAGMAMQPADRPTTTRQWHMLFTADAATELMRTPARLSRGLAHTARQTRDRRSRALVVAVFATIFLVGAAAAWLAIERRTPGTITAAAERLTADQLTQALEERRRADALVAEKKLLEEAASRQAEAEALAKRKADDELETARQQRIQAEAEVARLKADIESRRRAQSDRGEQAMLAERRVEEEARAKAEQEAATLRQAEDEANRKAAAEAEAKRRADEILAKAQVERQRAEEEAQLNAQEEARRLQGDEEARQKSEAEKRRNEEQEVAARKAEADNAAQQVARAGEATLRLALEDRQHLQVALTSLGFDTRGADGVFGQRTREMIAAWQKKRDRPPTGFVTQRDQELLLREAAAAISRYQEEQKKIADQKRADEDRRAEEQRKISEEKARSAMTAVPVPPAGNSAPLEEKTVTAARWTGPGYCPAGPIPYRIRVFPAKLDIELRGSWRSLPADVEGNLNSEKSRSFPGVANLSVTGNLRQRTFLVVDSAIGCSWRANF